MPRSRVIPFRQPVLVSGILALLVTIGSCTGIQGHAVLPTGSVGGSTAVASPGPSSQTTSLSAASVSGSAPVANLDTVLIQEPTATVLYSVESDSRLATVSFTVRNITEHAVTVRDVHVPASALISQTGAKPAEPIEVGSRKTRKLSISFHVAACGSAAKWDPDVLYEYKVDGGRWTNGNLTITTSGSNGWVHNLVLGLCG